MEKHKLKEIIFKLLDVLPSKLGYWVYHQLQKMTLGTIDNYEKTNRNSLKQISNILSHHNVNIEGENVVEIGSGWLPILPYLFKIELHVNCVYSYDINNHYSKKRNLLTSKQFSEQFKLNKDQALPEFIKYYPYTDISKVRINYRSKLVFSRFVLEHIKPDDILKIHINLFKETPENIKILHLISPSDHRAYFDNKLSHYDFLKYSENEWNQIQTKFDYHNRLRLPDYIEIFKKAGFKIEHLKFSKVDHKSKKYDLFEKLIIHSDYQNYSEEEILASSISIMLSK